MIYKISYERDGGKFERLKLSNQDKVVISPVSYHLHTSIFFSKGNVNLGSNIVNVSFFAKFSS